MAVGSGDAIGRHVTADVARGACRRGRIILAQNPHLVIFYPNKPQQKIEVSYLKNIQRNKAHLETLVRTLSKEPFLDTQAKITADKRTPPPYMVVLPRKTTISGGGNS
jgi:hypothetical protein